MRKAISLAVDRAAFVTTIFGGNAAPGRWMAPPEILGAHADDVPVPVTDPG